MRLRLLFLLLFLPLALLASWMLWSPWPSPVAEPPPWEPEVIVVLGGGDAVRIREAARLAERFQDAPVLVTGDGGYLEQGLRENQITEPRLLIEPDANSTWENAKFSAGILSGIPSSRVVLVTNWFHVPRAKAVFRKQFPERQFAVAWEPAPDPLPPWDRNSHRREKFAALYYLVRYGVWSF